MLLTIVGILIGGFVIGGLARLAVPGPDPMPVWMTILIGFLGSILGGIVGKILLGRTGGFLLALAGAILLVIAYRRFVQHRVQQRLMHFNCSVVADQAQFSKLVHEKTYARSSRADHLSQSFLIDTRVNRRGVPLFSKIRKQEEDPRETFLTGIE